MHHSRTSEGGEGYSSSTAGTTDCTFDPSFPRVIFWGPPHQYCITSRGASIHLPDIGIKLSIPEQALISTEKDVDLLIRPCYTGPFEMPAGYESASPTYLIQPSRKVNIQKDVTLEIHHHASLQSEDDCKEMAFLSASSTPQSQPAYVFKEITQSMGIFLPHIQVGKIGLRHFCFIKIAKRSKRFIISTGDELYYISFCMQEFKIVTLLDYIVDIAGNPVSQLCFACVFIIHSI